MNRLASETSPYLRQHADNAVDWFAWGPEAFDEARRRDVPIHLSVGYSACHWCHVMAHESFEDPETATVLNAGFVNIKVDREERPDVDAIYMEATQAMTGHGGWPMTVFMNADGEPFFCGTYFPDQARGGMPSFRDILAAIDDAWTNRRGEVGEQATKIADHLRSTRRIQPGDRPTTAQLDNRCRRPRRHARRTVGRVRRAPKFPQTMSIDFLLGTHARTGSTDALAAAEHSLDAMPPAASTTTWAAGSPATPWTSAGWSPIFEKMLYDNALLIRALPPFVAAHRQRGPTAGGGRDHRVPATRPPPRQRRLLLRRGTPTRSLPTGAARRAGSTPGRSTR